MNKILSVVAAVMSVVAVLLAMQGQTFRRVDAGGPKLRMLIAGSGSPAVVFDTGGEGSLEGWGAVPSHVSRFATAIAYDRAGNGLSDKAGAVRDGRNIATELHTALRNANASPPYILVGHSIGGPYMRVFAGMYPDEVAGIVLVDPTQEETVEWDKEHGFERPVQEQCSSTSERSCASVTLAQAHESLTPRNIPVFLIHTIAAQEVPFRSKQLDEIQQIQSRREPARLKFHKEWVERIPGGQLIMAGTSHGLINFEQPELVIGTIRKAVEKTKN